MSGMRLMIFLLSVLLKNVTKSLNGICSSKYKIAFVLHFMLYGTVLFYIELVSGLTCFACSVCNMNLLRSFSHPFL